MLWLFDSGAGTARPVQSARPGWLHVGLVFGSEPGQLTVGKLRAALLADLIRRVAERHRLHAVVWQRKPAPAGLLSAGDLLNIHPPESTAQPPAPLTSHPPEPAGQPVGDPLTIHPPQPTAQPPGPLTSHPPEPAGQLAARLDVLVTVDAEAAADAGAAAGAHRVWPAPVQAGGLLPGDLAARGLDPLALRLALLQHHHQRPATLNAEALATADASVRGWRRQVAAWAHCPSKPMCAGYLADVTGAFDDDLSTPAAVASLGALASDEQVPPGSKFETFAYLDQLFGLDLARDVGR